MALLLPLQAFAQIDDFLKSISTTLESVAGEITKKGKELEANLKKDNQESKPKANANANANEASQNADASSETATEEDSSLTVSTSASSAVKSKSNPTPTKSTATTTRTLNKSSPNSSTTSSTTSSTSARSSTSIDGNQTNSAAFANASSKKNTSVNAAAANRLPSLDEPNYMGKFQNGDTKLVVFQDNRGELKLLSSLCKGEWNFSISIGNEKGSLKRDGVLLTYQQDYSGFALATNDQYKNCLPNLFYARAVNPKASSLAKNQNTPEPVATPKQQVVPSNNNALAKEKTATKEKESEKKQVVAKVAVPKGCDEDETLIMSCTIKGQPLNYCYSDIEVRGVRLVTKLNGMDISFAAYDNRDSFDPPPYAEVQTKPDSEDSRNQHVSVFIKDIHSGTASQGKTFAVHECFGPTCGYYLGRPWFSIYDKKGQRIYNEACDDDSLQGPGFDYKYDKKGRVLNDGLYRPIKNKLNVNPPPVD